MANVKTFPPVNIENYSVIEDSTPIDPSDSSGGFGQFSLSIPETPDTKSLLNYAVELSVLTQGVTRGTVRALGSADGAASLTADSRLGQLAVERTAGPYNGTVAGMFYYYLGLCGIDSGIFVDDTIFDQPVSLPGWSGNVWDYLKKIATALQLEVSLVSNNAVLRPVRLRTAENYRDASRSWALDTSNLARSIEIFYYNNTYATSTLAYPTGGWNEDVTIYSVDANQTITVEIPLSDFSAEDGSGHMASLSSIQQPTAVDYVASDYTGSSVYAVSGNDGIGIPAAQWVGQGGSLTAAINEDSRSITLTIVGPDDATYSPYSISVASGVSNRYSSLRLVGNGVFSNRSKLTLNTSVNHDTISEEVGATVDNEFISTLDQAYAAGAWTLKAWGSPRYTINVSTFGVNRLGDNGSYRYPTIAEFNALYAGQDVDDFNTVWSGKTVAEFNEFMVDLVQDDFANQAFGNIAGARVRLDDAIFRIRSATNTASGITYTAQEDTTIEDFNAVWAGATIADFNEEWAGNDMSEFVIAPLRRKNA